MRESSMKPLAGRCILIVEDNFLILLELESTLLNAGARVVSCTALTQAAARIDEEEIDAGLLDVRIGMGSIAPVAQKLADRGKPFIFYTGQVAWDPELARWPEVPVVAKPAPPEVIVKALVQIMPGAYLTESARQSFAEDQAKLRPE